MKRAGARHLFQLFGSVGDFSRFDVFAGLLRVAALVFFLFFLFFQVKLAVIAAVHLGLFFLKRLAALWARLLASMAVGTGFRGAYGAVVLAPIRAGTHDIEALDHARLFF